MMVHNLHYSLNVISFMLSVKKKKIRTRIIEKKKKLKEARTKTNYFCLSKKKILKKQRAETF